MAQLFLLLSLWASSPADPVALAAKSVVKVEALDCRGANGELLPDRTGSGFAWGRERFLTSLHVLAGCLRYRVSFEVRPGEFKPRGAVVERLSQQHDLALLSLAEGQEPLALKPLRSATEPPDWRQKVWALGYPRGSRSIGSIELTVNRLKPEVPLALRLSERLAAELARRRVLDVKARVTNLQGPLLPGNSGGPIVNGRGEVLSVADGGLEHGTVSASWGIPIAHVASLVEMTSRDQVASLTTMGLLFSYNSESGASTTLLCGGLELRKGVTRSFRQIQRFADDPEYLARLLEIGRGAAEPENYLYDVYRETTTDAAIALPAGAELRSAGDHCRVDLHWDDAVIGVQLRRLEPGETLADARDRFLASFVPGSESWPVDPEWESLERSPGTGEGGGTSARWDGLKTVRESRLRGGKPRFEETLNLTIAAKRGVFVATAVRYPYWDRSKYDAVVAGWCDENLSCLPAVIARELRHLLHTTIGIQLSSFPRG